jgi:hypothetical protein
MGKSTLIQDFLKIYPDYVFEEEPYYQLQEKHDIEFAEDPTLENIIEQLNHNLERLDFHEAHTNVIFERCPLDFIAYSMYLVHEEGLNLEDTSIVEMFTGIKESLEYLDLIVFLPMTKEHPISCQDDEDTIFRKAVDTTLKQLYREELFDLIPSYDRPQVIELWGSPEERMRKLKYYLEENRLI